MVSELRSVGVKSSAAVYPGLLQEVCKTHLVDFPVHKSSSCLRGIIFTLLISSGVSSKGHSFTYWVLLYMRVLMASDKEEAFLSLLTCIPSLLSSQTTWLVRAVWHRGLRQRSGWHDDCIPSECQCPSPAESSSLPVDQGFLSCTTEWGWCDSAESGSCFCSSFESDPLARVLPTFQLSAHWKQTQELAGKEKWKSGATLENPWAWGFSSLTREVRNFFKRKSLYFEVNV